MLGNFGVILPGPTVMDSSVQCNKQKRAHITDTRGGDSGKLETKNLTKILLKCNEIEQKSVETKFLAKVSHKIICN